MPACLPEQLCSTAVGPKPNPAVPHSSSSSCAGAFASRLRTAASCSGEPRCEAEAIAISSVVRASRARTSGSAWKGFAEDRRNATRAASPACSTTVPSRTATACTACVASTTPPRLTLTTIGSTRGRLRQLANGRHFSYLPTTIERLRLPVPDYDAADVLVVSETEQLRALSEDVRLPIVA